MRTRIIDGHCDTLLRMADDGADLGDQGGAGHIDLQRLRQANIQLQFFALFSSPKFGAAQGLARTLQLLDAFYTQLDRHPELFLVQAKADVAKTDEGRTGALLVLEGGDFITDLAQIRMLHRLGVRSVMLTWNGRNLMADGAFQRPDLGLSSFGKECVAQMQQLGMLLDVSHLNLGGFWDLLECTNGPVVASHSNARALCDNPRNLYDDQLDALKQRGGVVGLNFYTNFLTDASESTMDDVLRHYEYIAERLGPEHVGLGTDYDGINSAPTDLPDCASLARLADVMAGRYQPGHVEQFLYGNMARVLTQVLPEGGGQR